KGKIDPLETAAAASDEAPVGAAAHDAVMALVQLGQSQEAATKRVRAILAEPGAPADTASIVRKALASR
ncbi:MAG: hypothetical protein IJ678_07665, partial [Kiritimatiellae bacterium]|nr:hypothetical protein [Kiritimatiellia bacterium]